MKVLTCRDNTNTNLVLGGSYLQASINSESKLVWLVGFDEPYDWNRFDELYNEEK